jgi:hypothetical protein
MKKPPPPPPPPPQLLIRSSFGVFNFTLPAYKPNFAEVAGAA